MEFINGVLFIIFLIAAILIILLVLFRPSEKGGGLGGVFGGGAQDMAFGVKTTKIIDKVILVLAILFVLLSVLVTMTSQHHIARGTDTTETSE
jgi:protein translocase SecG subunit